MKNTEKRLQGLLMDFDLICSDEHFNRKDNDEYDVTKIQIKELFAESIQQAIAEERERIERKIKQAWNYPCNCDRKNILCIHDFSQMKVALSSLDKPLTDK